MKYNEGLEFQMPIYLFIYLFIYILEGRIITLLTFSLSFFFFLS